MPVTVGQKLRGFAVPGLLLLAGAAPSPTAFTRLEGLNLNVFVRRGPVAAHVVLRSGADPRIIVAFPAGNSGVGLWFEPIMPAKWSMQAAPVPVAATDASGRSLHGTRFVASIHTPRLVIRQAVLSSIRVLRDYQALGKVPPEVTASPSSMGTATTTWERDRLDGAPGYRLSMRVIRGASNGTTIDAAGGDIELEFTALTGETPLTPVQGTALIDERAVTDETALNSLTFLSYREKFLAGSWRFDTYFGRDTLMSVRLLMPVLQPSAVETGLRSVLERLSSDGRVAHEEDIGEFAVLDHRRSDGSSSDAPVYDYKMIDGDFLLAPVARAWLIDDPRGRGRAAAFLSERNGGERLGDRLMRNLRLAVAEAAPFGRRPEAANLIALRTGVPVGEWRDSSDGLGGGRFPYDVNAVLVPAALDAAVALDRAGLLAPYATSADHKMLSSLAGVADIWREKAPALFLQTVPSAKARDAVSAYAAKAGVPSGDALEAVGEVPLRFHALALAADGTAVPIENSDEGFALLFGDPTPDQLAIAADTIERPFPAGLRTGAGMLVANPTFAPPSLQAKFGPSAYHGTVVWSWQQALAAAGLARQLARVDLPQEVGRRLRVAQSCLWDGINASQSVQSSELWSWRYAGGRYAIAPFGASGGDADESNAAQLWSTVYLALRRPSARAADRCPA